MQLKIKVAPTFLLFRDGDKVRQWRAVSRLSKAVTGHAGHIHMDQTFNSTSPTPHSLTA